MALQIWLPLNGTLENKGCTDVTIVNNGATVNTAGKIGSCYSFDGSDDYISIVCPKLNSIFSGGAHGNTIRTSQTWNLNYQRMIPLYYFFDNNPYFIINVLKKINNQIKENPENYFDNYCDLVLQTFNEKNFYITQKNVIIYFQQYDIAPYSSGIPTFEVK